MVILKYPSDIQKLIDIFDPYADSESHGAGAVHFNPRSPCGERRSCPRNIEGWHGKFQSTLPLRGATVKQKNTESLRDSTYNFANLIKQVLWSTQNHY